MQSHSLELYCNHSIPRSFVPFAVEQFTELFSDTCVLLLKDNVLNCIPQDTSQTERQKIDDVFANALSSLDIISSEYKRMKLLESNACFIKQVDYIIEHRESTKYENGIVVLNINPAVAKFIPLRDIFKVIFEIPGALATIKTYMNELYQEKCVMKKPKPKKNLLFLL